MEEENKKKTAMFRYGVISEFVNGRDFARGEKKRLMAEKCRQKWNIPGSMRTRISQSVLKEWIRRYQDSGNKLESLYPKEREDKGNIRAVDGETIAGLVQLRKELPDKPLLVFLKIARERQIIQPGLFISRATAYRILQTHAEEIKKQPEDRRKFEAEYVNELWQSDVMHGPMITAENKKQKKCYLLAVIDDHSRFIVHAEFYWNESLNSYLDFLRKAFMKRGIPKKLYVDNGAAFRSYQLEYICASLGANLVHAKPYKPEGKGKIERWFRTLRMSFMHSVNNSFTLEKINQELEKWIENYHDKYHSSTREKPKNRFANGLEHIRSAPDNLEDYFRKTARRTVRGDRTISFQDKLYEVPVELIGKQIQLLYHDHDLEKVEVLYQGKTYGFVQLLDANVNYRVSRAKKNRTELIPTSRNQDYTGGNLFDARKGEHHE